MGTLEYDRRLGAVALILTFAGTSCADATPSSPSLSGLDLWTVSEELRIGSADDSATSLDGVGSLALGGVLVVDGHERMYVSQSARREIRVFGPTGERLGAYGSAGDGPGEFRQIFRIGIFADTLYASDPSAGRISLFGLDGTLLETIPLRPEGLGPDWVPVPPWWIDTGGTAVSMPGYLPMVREPGIEGQVMLVRVDRSGGVLDTVSLDVRPATGTITMEGPLGPMVTPQPFGAPITPVVSRNGDRVAVFGEMPRPAETVDVTVLRAVGDTVWSETYAYVGRPLTDGAVDRAVETGVGRLSPQAFPDREDAARQYRAGMTVPDHAPPISGGIFTEDGSLWLRRATLGEAEQRWTVIDPSGTPLADVVLPESFLPAFVRDDTVWGMEADALGIPYVVRYHIDR